MVTVARTPLSRRAMRAFAQGTGSVADNRRALGLRSCAKNSGAPPAFDRVRRVPGARQDGVDDESWCTTDRRRSVRTESVR